MASGGKIPFSGIMLIIVGGLFLADQMGALHIGEVFRVWWPAILVLAGVVNLIERPASIFGPIVMIGVGTALVLANLGYVKIGSVWHLWPLVLIAVGLNIVFGHRGGKG